MQWIDLTETDVYRTGKVLVSKKEEIKCNNIMKREKMINFDDVIKENRKEHRTWSILATNFDSLKQHINIWRLWIWKNKFII